MIHLYAPIGDSSRAELFFRCVSYEMGGFDLTTFWRGERVRGIIPANVRIVMSDGQPSDFTLLPMSWYLFSNRAAERIKSRAGNAVQFIDAPLYNHSTNERIEGYKILNVTRRSRCLDLSRSKVRYEAQHTDRIETVLHFAFDKTLVTEELHVFRASEHFVWMFFSKILMDELMSGDILQNLAFLEYGGRIVREVRRIS